MPKPSKPLVLMTKHMSNDEKKARKDAEEALLTGEAMQSCPEVRKSKTAIKYFKRLSELYKKIGKNDALIENIINRYCLLAAEIEQFEQYKTDIDTDLAAVKGDDNITLTNKIKISQKLRESLLEMDKTIMTKRRMMLNIERESIMTLASQLRSIPKREPHKVKSEMEKFLERRNKGDSTE